MKVQVYLHRILEICFGPAVVECGGAKFMQSPFNLPFEVSAGFPNLYNILRLPGLISSSFPFPCQDYPPTFLYTHILLMFARTSILAAVLAAVALSTAETATTPPYQGALLLQGNIAA